MEDLIDYDMFFSLDIQETKLINELKECFKLGSPFYYDAYSKYYNVVRINNNQTSFTFYIKEILEQTRNQNQRPTGGSTHYYELPKNATELKHLIRHKKMSHPIGEAFCSLYRLNDNGEYKRNLEKAKYYIETELQYLEEGRD